MPEAKNLLGRPFEFYFKVVHGKKLGRQLGTPTINQIIPDNHVLPKFGVYASVVFIGDKLNPSVTNVGVKPTVGSTYVSAETYIMGYDGDLYGQTVRVGLIKYIRTEMRFENLAMLKAQINRDALHAAGIAKHYLNFDFHY